MFYKLPSQYVAVQSSFHMGELSKRVLQDWTYADMMKDRETSSGYLATDKRLNSIANDLEHRYGKFIRGAFESATFSYFVSGEEDVWAEDETISKVWLEAKEIIDEIKAEKAQGKTEGAYEGFCRLSEKLERIEKEVLAPERRREAEKKLAHLAVRLKVDQETLGWVLGISRFMCGQPLTERFFVENISNGKYWHGYEDYLHLICTEVGETERRASKRGRSADDVKEQYVSFTEKAREHQRLYAVGAFCEVLGQLAYMQKCLRAGDMPEYYSMRHQLFGIDEE